MGLLLDTETLIHWATRPQVTPSWTEAHAEEDVFLSVITADELLRATAESTDPGARTRRRAFVESILEVFPLMPLDRAIARAHAGIRPQLVRRTPWVESDVWLAATCIAHGLTFVTTRAGAFRDIPGLTWEAWSADSVDP
jgi:predicted nucleic acid-binding protein